MNERFIYLMEKYFDNDISTEEKNEFEKILSDEKELRSEFEEQKRIKEVFNKMRLKNPSKEFWDSYWLSVYNRLERGLAWLAVLLGGLIVIIYASIELVNNFLSEADLPVLVKWGIGILVFGALLLLFSVIREKFSTAKRDKYKEIQR